MSISESSSGFFGFVDLSEYVLSSSQHGNKKFLSYYSFLSLFRNKEFWRQIEALAKTDDLRITLRGFDVLRGHGLLGLLLLCRYIRKKYRRVPTVEFPEDISRLRGLLRLRFLDFCLSAACPFEVTNTFSIDMLDDRIEGYPFPLGFSIVDGGTIGGFIERLQGAVGPGSPFTYDMGEGLTDVAHKIEAIGFIIAEVFRNVVMHSEAEPNEGCGYLMVEKTPKALTLFIGDIGVGIRRSLASKEKLTGSDTQAIKRALLYRAQDGEDDLRGLFGVAWHIKEIGGEILIRSDSSNVRLMSDGSFPTTRDQVVNWIKNSAQPYSQTNLHFGFPGTQIIVEIKREER